MSLWEETLAWLLASETWSGAGSVQQRVLEHLGITAGVLAVAVGIALPLGLAIGHRRSGSGPLVVLAGAARAVPTLGLLTLFGLALGIGLGAPVAALIVLAVPPILAATYAGISATEPAAADAARAVGFSERQIVFRVELPLAAPVILGGLRSATLQIVATATLAAYTADEGLGRFIFTGLKSREYGELIGGSLLVVILALALDGAYALLKHFVVTIPSRTAVEKRSS